MIKFDHIFDNLAEFVKDLLLVVSVTATQHEPR